MRTSLIIIIVLVTLNNLRAQDRKEVIEKVRDRYYRITGEGVSLDKLSLDSIDYYFENYKLSIAKKQTNLGRFEYYYDFNNEGYFPYFIFFKSNTLITLIYGLIMMTSRT